MLTRISLPKKPVNLKGKQKDSTLAINTILKTPPFFGFYKPKGLGTVFVASTYVWGSLPKDIRYDLEYVPACDEYSGHYWTPVICKTHTKAMLRKRRFKKLRKSLKKVIKKGA